MLCDCCRILIVSEEDQRDCSSCGDIVCKNCIQGVLCETEPLCASCVQDTQQCVDCSDLFFEHEKPELMQCFLCNQYLCCCCTTNPCFDTHREFFDGNPIPPDAIPEEKYIVVCGKCLKKIHQINDPDEDRDFNLQARIIEDNVFVSGPGTFMLKEWFKSNGFHFMKDAWIISQSKMSVKELRSRLQKEKRRFLLDYDLVVSEIDKKNVQ